MRRTRRAAMIRPRHAAMIRPRHAAIIRKVVSGGQTGVDRAALDAALALGVPAGGWCPKGRLAEDGVIPDRYPLRETEAEAYGERTRRNVRDSDATLVLVRGAPEGGTRLTVEAAGALGRPLLVVDLASGDTESVRAWLAANGIGVLNVAGPRESEAPGIHGEALAYLRPLLAGAVAGLTGSRS